MALLKKAMVSSGVDIEYWRVISVEYDAINEIGNVRIALYLNKSTRDSGKTPVETTVISLSNWTKEESQISGILQAAYQKIKTLPEMRDAVDC